MSRTKNKNIFAKNKISAKRKFSLILSAVMLFILFTGLVIFVNEHFLMLDFIPTSADISHFLGMGRKPYVKPLDNEAAVYFIDVGQGDCELIRAKNYNILIDSGSAENADDVIGFITGAGVKKLDIVIATHPHSDHIGGMYKILQNFDVEKVIMPELPEKLVPTTVFFEKMLNVIEKKKINASYAEAGDRFKLDERTYIEIIAPVFHDYDDMNNFSVAARFVHGENEFLFTGDLERDGELDIIETPRDISSDVIKIAHHGSAGSSSAEFLEKVMPKIAVIEVAAQNDFGHPREEVFERLRAVGCKTSYTTSRDGNIAIISDGANLRVETENRLDNAA